MKEENFRTDSRVFANADADLQMKLYALRGYLMENHHRTFTDQEIISICIDKCFHMI